MESTKEAEVGAEGVGLDDLLSLRRPLTVREIASLWPRFALAAQRLIDSLAGRAAQVAELEQRARTEELLTAEQAAQRLAVPESFVRQAGRDGRIQVVNVGSYVRFASSEIDRVKREGVGEGAPSDKVTNLATQRCRRLRPDAA